MKWLGRRIGLLSSLALSPLLQRADTHPGVHALRVRNGGRHVVRALFVAPSGSLEWGADRLANPLPPGRGVEIVLFSEPGAFEIRVVYADGREELLRAVDPESGDVVLRY